MRNDALAPREREEGGEPKTIFCVHRRSKEGEGTSPIREGRDSPRFPNMAAHFENMANFSKQCFSLDFF